MDNLTLKINDRLLEFTFGLGFLGELLDHTNLSIDELVDKLNKNPFKMIPVIMFESADYVLKKQSKDIDFTQYDFTDWIDLDGGVGSESIVRFLDAFTHSLTKDVPKEDELVEESKKK